LRKWNDAGESSRRKKGWRGCRGEYTVMEVLCPFCQEKMIETNFGDLWAEYSCEKCKSQKVVMRKAEREFQRDRENI
jgi:hypothetical protein